MLGKIVIIQGIKSRAELNNQLGIASSFDEAKGRYAVKLLSDFTFVALKPENLVDWAARGPTRSVTKEEIKAADIPESLLELIKSGVVLSQESGIAEAAYEKLLNPQWHGIEYKDRNGIEYEKLHDRYARKMLDGGFIEMAVQSLDAHIANRLIFLAIFFVSQMLLDGEDGTEYSRAAELKDRAVGARYFERLCAILKAHTTSDVQGTVLSAFAQGASGGAFVGTEARRNAAVKAGGLQAVCAAMKLAPHRSAVQHFGITAVDAICSFGTARGVKPDMSRCDAALEAGAHLMTLEAMRRFGHVRSENGVCIHVMEGADGKKMQCAVPGSILQSGCHLLHCLVYDGDEAKVKVLNDAGTLKVVAAVVRADPACTDDNEPTFGDTKRLEDTELIEPLVIKLLGESNMTDMLDPEDYMTLVGTSEEPGFMLRAVAKYAMKEKLNNEEFDKKVEIS